MDATTRQGFLKLALLVEGGTVLLALTFAWFADIDPWEHWSWSWQALGIGLAGTLPIFAVYFVAQGTRSVAVEMMGEPLSRCRWYDLVGLAVLAGLGEELLFRGVLQPWISGWSATAGFLGANVLFGLVHVVTPVYALLAMGIGMYLSWLCYGLFEANLVPAVVAHGVYDYVAFLLIIREHRLVQSP